MRTTFRDMDISDLGQDATDADLQMFRNACVCRRATTGESDEQVTEWMWNDGDWMGQVQEYIEAVA
jgi:hypothetical protein